jgi:hypothetical protein
MNLLKQKIFFLHNKTEMIFKIKLFCSLKQKLNFRHCKWDHPLQYITQLFVGQAVALAPAVCGYVDFAC